MDAVADRLRASAATIAAAWEAELRSQLPQLAGLTRAILLDELFEFLAGLADWIEGRTEAAAHGFEALVKGHALQRLGYGIGLETLTREYAMLRLVLMRELRDLRPTEQVRASLVSLHEGMDRAMAQAIERYAHSRDEVRERFISILGHDLRTPLNAIAVSAGILATDPEITGERREIAERIEEAAARMKRMIADVLDFARSHLGGGIPAVPKPDDMAEICRAVRDEVAAAHPDRPITIDVRGDLRGSFDRDRVMQALANLLDNAIQHGSGEIEVRAREAPDRHAVVTEVTSHGPAIPPPVLEHLFEPFAHGEGEPRSGLGLGLYIVEQIALAHGGHCEVTSSRAGTTFTIRWPRASRRRASG
jgi:signal transduction histidine kinase